MSELKDLLEKLSNAHGISGYEGDIREIVRSEIEDYVDEVRIDRIGNIIGTKKGKSPSIMIAAHMDEIGLMAKYVDDNGFIRFVKVGGWFDQTLLSQRVIVKGKNGPINGVIGSKPPHRMDAEEQKKPIKADDMFIDIGAKNREDAEEMGVVPGSTVVIDMELKELGNGKVTGKAFDNRAGVAMMIAALKRMKTDLTVYAVGTVQEEVGLKGAKTSAFGLNPDVAIATDVTIPGDHPGIDKKDASIEMGKGPSVNVLDASGRGLITPEPVLKWLTEAATRNNIPIQLDVSSGGTTDATAIFLARDGIPSGGISIPCRYIHSPVEVMDIDDLDKSAELIARAVECAGEFF